ncbi:uncharacterized protein TNCV_1632451 [Trichonephila clavipes]|nr:uncharacterized protein TNCV_1632451 [Trichonephila clavipes]
MRQRNIQLKSATSKKDKTTPIVCINCNAYGHTACYTKCPNFPKPRKGYPLLNRNSKKFTSNNVVEGIPFANMVSGETKITTTPVTVIINRKDKVLPMFPPLTKLIPLTSKTSFKIITNIFKQFPKLKQILPDLKKTTMALNSKH